MVIIIVVKQQSEKAILMQKLEDIVMIQKEPFVSHDIASKFFDTMVKGEYATKRGSVITYASQLCTKLTEMEKLRVVDVINRGDSMPKKVLEVIA